VLAEGTRGSLTKKLVAEKKLDNINPQSYGIGIRNCGTCSPAGSRLATSRTLLAGQFPQTCMAAGGFTAGKQIAFRLGWSSRSNMPTRSSIRTPHFKSGRCIRSSRTFWTAEKLVRYGAKSLPYGGWYAMPRNTVDGVLIIGDSGSFLDSQRLKGIHLAMKSGMLAAETIFEALKAGDSTTRTLEKFQRRVEQSYIRDEMWKVRNFHQSFQHGMFVDSFTLRFSRLLAGAALSIRCAPKRDTSTIRKSTLQNEPRTPRSASRATAS